MANDAKTELLTTDEVAELLKVHPKHVYRLIRQGLPGQRIGREWRFGRSDVTEWLKARGHRARGEGAGGGQGVMDAVDAEYSSSSARILPSLIAAHGGPAIELLMLEMRRAPEPLLGVVPADRGEALDLLASGRVLAAGFHGGPGPELKGAVPLAHIHLVEREVGLVLRRGVRLPDLADLGSLCVVRLASRPPSAGVRFHLDNALKRQGLDPQAIHEHALSMCSHEEVVCAVVRGEADVGLSVRSWAARLGLDFHPLASEAYGIVLRADQMGDRRVIGLCQAAQSRSYRRALGSIAGHGVDRTGDIRVGSAVMEQGTAD